MINISSSEFWGQDFSWFFMPSWMERIFACENCWVLDKPKWINPVSFPSFSEMAWQLKWVAPFGFPAHSRATYCVVSHHALKGMGESSLPSVFLLLLPRVWIWQWFYSICMLEWEPSPLPPAILTEHSIILPPPAWLVSHALYFLKLLVDMI